MDLIDLVNPLQGTDSRADFSTGNTLPLIGVPRGMTYWTPQTSDGNFAFDRRAPKLAGFRATHMPSPWMGDYGHFDVTPVVGEVGPDPASRASGYRADDQHARPHLYRARLIRYDTAVELTATARCGVLRFTYPGGAGGGASVVFQVGRARVAAGDVRVRRDRGRAVVLGRSRSHNGGVAGEFACHFVAEIDGAEVVGVDVLDGRSVRDGGAEARAEGERPGVCLRLRPTGPVTVRVATSFIDADQARLNLDREVGGRSFEQVADETAARWREWLGRVEADGGTEAQRRVLYSCLYRVGLFPTAMHEPDAAARPRHFSPYDGRIHSGALYTNNGFWDTHRTVYPLLARLDPAGLGEIVDGYLQGFRQGGWLGRWISPGYRDCMIGTHADAVIAEAVARGVGGFDYEEAYAAIRRNAFDPGDPSGRFGRVGLDDYVKLGYVPADRVPQSLACTLDYAYGDWCVAQVARRLGHDADCAALMRRSQNYRNVWDGRTRFFRARRSDGSWDEPWGEFRWGGGYVEGGPWQHAFNVPHDVPGLAELHGGPDALLERVGQMLATPPRFETGTYGGEIHEMTEMAFAADAAGDFGQYAHSNQPCHGFLWLPAALGRPDVTERHVRRVMAGLYSPDAFAGDEDNGEMAAWYVLAATGEFPHCPGGGRDVSVAPWPFARLALRPPP